MSMLLALIGLGVVIVVSLIVFTILIFKPGSGKKRTDDRDAKKSGALGRQPDELYETQQAAELQVGKERERTQPSRFEPDRRNDWGRGREAYPHSPSGRG